MPAEVTEIVVTNLEIEWPNLNDTIRKKLKYNRFFCIAVIMIILGLLY